MSIRVSHVAAAVSDLEESTRFYIEGLGFTEGPTFDSGDEVAGVSEVATPVAMRSRYLVKEGFTFEIMGWETPPVHGAAATMRNQRGLTHLSFEVDDIEATQARLLELGATIIEGARVHLDKGTGGITLVFLADPDGIRIELMQRHAAPS